MNIEMEMGQKDKERQRWGETERNQDGEGERYQAETSMERQRWGVMRLIEILGRETGKVREEQEINIKDLSDRQSKERDRETGVEREPQGTETEESN